ncbi:hypothetical protein SLS63_011550 [Diaporthe eres]|uniref:CorA-like transporter domain-containing protein n=1 Tax=Diaporthe eres TaxID=83184 RepID=A0ABR1NTW3_DIAER
MQLPTAFVDSCLQHYRFPLSVASKTAYGSSLVAYYDRLNKHAPRLFIDPDDESFVIPFKDITKNANGEWAITKYNALDGDKLKEKLGDTTKKDPNNPAKLVGAFATRPDPRCRIIWKIRQAAIYHRFDLGSGTALWIIGDPRETVKNDLKDVLPEGPVPSEFNFGTVPDAFMASLDTHLVLVNWASASWRWHIQDLEETIDDMTRPAILFDYESRDQPEVAPRAVTLVQEYEDKVNETLMVIEANLKIFSSLLASYTALVEDKNFPLNERDACKAAVGMFSTKIEEYAYDLRMQADRARVLSKVATDRKNIVLQQLQTQTAIKQEALASSMWAFSNNSQKETIAMRIITAITLLYLPPTFVCTFFGTDVIKYQDDGKGSVYFSIEALKSFFYVTVPLWSYNLVIKQFADYESFDREWRIHNSIRHRNATRDINAISGRNGIVKCFGWYEHREKDAETGTIRTYCNLVLERGTQDLYSAFHKENPPITQIEIDAFWSSLFDVAEALASIQKIDEPDDICVRYVWHGDIKPENILDVQGRFKLADPDYYTARVLDVVDNSMLIMPGENRISGSDLELALADIKDHAMRQCQGQPQPPEDILRFLEGVMASTGDERTPTLEDIPRTISQSGADMFKEALLYPSLRSEGRIPLPRYAGAFPTVFGENPAIAIDPPWMTSYQYQDTSLPLRQEAGLSRPSLPRIRTVLSSEGTSAPVNLPITFWEVEAELEQQNKKSSGLMKSFGRMITPNSKVMKGRDDQLAKHFVNRDLVYLVDNASTMANFWKHATYLLRVLVWRSLKLDEDGMELVFTTGKPDLGLEPKGKGRKQKPESFVKKMDDARPDPQGGVTTNMKVSLEMILGKHMKDNLDSQGETLKRGLTILVLTDGLWAANDDNHVDEYLANFIKTNTATRGWDGNSPDDQIRRRPIGIQFIRFGHYPEAIRRLQRLDDELKERVELLDKEIP